jgi:integrase
MAKSLTAKSVENLRPRAARYEVRDGGARGLYLVMQPSGKRSWCLRYRHAGRSVKLTLDRVESLADARRRAAEAMCELEAGRDPARTKLEAKTLAARADAERKRDTVEQLAAQFIEKHVGKLRPRTRVQATHIFTTIVLPEWRGRSIHDIQRRDVRELIEQVARNRPVTANRTLATLSRFFGWCCERDVLVASPAVGVKRPHTEVARERTLSDSEIVSLLRACDALGDPVAAGFVRLLLLLGQRRGEIAGMKRSEIDGDLLRIPAERMKGKQLHALPLSRAALAIVERMPVIDGSDRVFPSLHFGRIKERLDAHMPATTPAWTLHDLRRSCASGMAAIGVAVPVIEKALAHRGGSFKGVAAVYQRHSFVPEMRAALERWAEHVERLERGTPAENVVALARR